jgi:hypothetical protein
MSNKHQIFENFSEGYPARNIWGKYEINNSGIRWEYSSENTTFSALFPAPDNVSHMREENAKFSTKENSRYSAGITGRNMARYTGE